jgi:transcriptional regulator GlxA family with amidase domain
MDPRIVWARQEMERRLHEPWVLEHLAAAMALSLARFTRLFAEHEGITPADYLQKLRLARAKLLLERTFLSVNQVMVLVGVSDTRLFEDDFRHVYGVAPWAVRERVGDSSAREQ